MASRVEKLTRARAFAAQAEAENVRLVRGAWNDAYLTQLHHQPDWPHDDMLDASSGAFNDLTGEPEAGSFSDLRGTVRKSIMAGGRR